VQTRAGIAIKRVFRSSLGLAIVLALMTAAVASAQDTVALSEHASFGTILTDAAGMTLYTWQGDEPGVNNCTGQCANAWPVLMSDSTVDAPQGLPGVLGVSEQADGTFVVTYNDWPLHYFARDAAPGDANGQGSNGFGSPW
jgi:predicted lipoprotein with Yx(FWY)xxD motif